MAAQGTARLADDPGFSTAPVKEVREVSALHAYPTGSIYITDAGRGLTFRLDARGRLLDQKEIPAPALMSIDAYGQAATIEGESLRQGRQSWPLTWHDGKRKVSLRPAVPPLPRRDGSWWFTDERGGAVFEFDRSLVFRKSVWSGDGLSADRARVGPDDTVWLMDTGAGRLVRLDPSGQARSIDLKAAPASVRAARDLAVDALGAVWVLDAGRRALAVFSPSGQYEGALRLEGASGSLEAVEVDPGGGILVYDARERRLRRFVEVAPTVMGASAEVR